MIKKLLICLVLLTSAACTNINDGINKQAFDKGVEVCTKNDGLEFIRPTEYSFIDNVMWATVYCNNGARFDISSIIRAKK